MSKRNFILLIIILIIVAIVFFVFLSFRKNNNTPTGDNSGINFVSQFNPFGKITNNPEITPPVDVSGYQPNPTPTINANMRKVSSMPIAGYTIFSKERLKDVVIVPPVDSTSLPQATPDPSTSSGSTTKTSKNKTPKPTPPLTEFMPTLRYVAREDGNIYQTFADKIEERKFTTTIIPKIYEAYFGNNGMSVLMRYLKNDNKNIISFLAPLPKEYLGADTSITNEIKGSFLPENIKDVSISPDTMNVFYLIDNKNGDSMTGISLNLATNKKTTIFDSPFTEWLSNFPNNKMITFTTKPSVGVPGYMYALDPTKTNYNLTKIINNVNGLTTLTSPDGKSVIYSNDSLTLSIYHTDTKTSNTLGLRTMPEKCTWNIGSDTIYCGVPKNIPRGNYPDAWYQGVNTFSDQIWKVNTKTSTMTMLADPATIEGGEDIDSIKLSLENAENYLFFVNKKDSYLWELKLK